MAGPDQQFAGSIAFTDVVDPNSDTGLVRVGSWEGDPNGVVTAEAGSMLLDFDTPATWINVDGGTAWERQTSTTAAEQIAIEAVAGIRWGRLSASYFGGGTLVQDGILQAVTVQDAISALVPAFVMNNDPAVSQDTSGVLNNAVYARGNTQALARLFSPAQVRPIWFETFMIPNYTSVRMFSGFADSTDGTPVGSDNPPINRAGLQFSTARDTTFQISMRSGADETLIDTGVVPVAEQFYQFQMYADGAGGWPMRLLNIDTGTVLWSGLATGDGLPAAVGSLNWWSGLATLVADPRSFVRHQISLGYRGGLF